MLKVVQATSSCKNELPETSIFLQGFGEISERSPRAFPESTNIPRPALAEGLFAGTSSHGNAVNLAPTY